MNDDLPRTECRRWRNVIRTLRRLIVYSLAVYGFVSLLYHVTLHASRVVSPSMSPAIQGEDWDTGDVVLTEKLSYWFRRPQRWEVITFKHQGTVLMKRVVGLPGEKVQLLRGGKLVIDGQPSPLPKKLSHLRYYAYGNLTADQIVECGDGYFVLGDDSKDSDDSRYLGPIPNDALIGRAWWIINPPQRRGPIDSQPVPLQ